MKVVPFKRPCVLDTQVSRKTLLGILECLGTNPEGSEVKDKVERLVRVGDSPNCTVDFALFTELNALGFNLKK